MRENPMSADAIDKKPRLAIVIEGSRSQADHRALSMLAEAASAIGLSVQVLHHGLGRLARFRLRQQLRGFSADLYLVSGAASLTEVRRLATLAGKPVVACYWPHGVVHNLHLHRHPEDGSTKRPLPSHAIIGTETQRQAVHAFASGAQPWPMERLHTFPVPQGEAAPSPELLRDIVELLIELLGERSHRSLGHGLLKASAARVLTVVTRPRTLSLAYHQVVRELRGVDPNLVVGATTFERQVKALLVRGYRPVLQADQAKELLGAEPSREPSFAISFDDGYLDTLTVAAPILKSLGVPFTVYCITDLVTGKHKLPWYELVQHALASASIAGHALAVLGQFDSLRRVLTHGLPGFRLVPSVMQTLKALADGEREKVCAALWDEVGNAVLARPQVPRYLDRESVQQLLTFGAEVSSHTCRHPILTRLSDAELLHELRESKRLLSELVGQCPGLSYPNGDSDERVEAAVQAAGYEYAVRIEPVAGTPQRFRLGRQMVSELLGMGLDGSFSEKIFLAKLLRKR